MLGAVMKAKKGAKNERPSLLDVVALLTDLPAQRLARALAEHPLDRIDDVRFAAPVRTDNRRHRIGEGELRAIGE